ncbi:hypothetical protein TNIN_203951 [Trichonephila inaurata madagascariensis]|uniref:Secreted protein n=1 Tax=Trichonephila inaurata madagascariensis TaxID=2747483 RepID=A0A8X7BWA6_9ARAC|nr:hypothetical protein TNIN_203951 [Trichonephila inaurata madagascariensis]
MFRVTTVVLLLTLATCQYEVPTLGCYSPVSCYGCGKPGFIKSKYPKCSLKKESASSVNAIQMFTCLNPSQYLYLTSKPMKLQAQFELIQEPAIQSEEN